MKSTSAFILQMSVVSASIFDTILPTTQGTITSDPWRCYTHTFESFFDVPKPTGALFDALVDHGDEMQKGCKSTLTDAMGMRVCTFPPHSELCDFTKFAPSSLLTEYSSYGSIASSWWAEHSSEAVEYAEYCPNRWFRAMTSLPHGAVWLNDTIAFAGCHAAAHASGEPKTNLETTATAEPSVAQTGATATASNTGNLDGVAGATATASDTGSLNGIAGKRDDMDI
ncbi:hypothetical protein FPOAC2_07490 [Fusarium poae]|uniref:DUF7735 domain-containing protein n=1 Tax=Fusarium poae TaxID=36050 RepID=A0A1B8AII4_FUSPO|nr:hypothetical protein FPOAC1_010092 [Fusarium poae]KAG8670659.1 hypothetical protein FPOAC1_010092 [Fusarium poae]OBS20308.1 hypothetical protein FPOA_06682 [Fusarium poae]